MDVNLVNLNNKLIEVKLLLLSSIILLLKPKGKDFFEVETTIPLDSSLVEECRHPCSAFTFSIINVSQRKTFIFAAPSYLDKIVLMEEIQAQIDETLRVKN